MPFKLTLLVNGKRITILVNGVPPTISGSINGDREFEEIGRRIEEVGGIIETVSRRIDETNGNLDYNIATFLQLLKASKLTRASLKQWRSILKRQKQPSESDSDKQERRAFRASVRRNKRQWRAWSTRVMWSLWLRMQQEKEEDDVEESETASISSDATIGKCSYGPYRLLLTLSNNRPKDPDGLSRRCRQRAGQAAVRRREGRRREVTR